MTYDKKISSFKILSLVEQKLGIGRIEVSRSDDNWIVSTGFRHLLGLGDTPQQDIVNVIVKTIHADDRVGFLQDVALMHSGFVPPAKVFRIISPVAMVAYIHLQFEGIPGDEGEMQGFIGIAQDVSQEELLAQARRSAADCVDILMQVLNVDCFWRKNKRGEIFDCSVRGNLRRTDTTVLGRAWVDTIREDQREKVLAVTGEAMAAGKAYAVSVDVIGEDGIHRPYLSKGFPMKDENDQITEWCGVVSEQAVIRTGENMSAEDMAGAKIINAAGLATGATVRALCAFFGWTYDEAASRSDLSTTTINRIVSSSGRLVGQFRRKSVESILIAFFNAGARFHITTDRQLFISRSA